MIEILWNPPKKQLRHFAGLWFPLFCLLIGGIIGEHLEMWREVWIFWGIAGVLSLIGSFHPPFIRPIFIALMVLSFPMGWVVSHLLLGFVFYCIITPIGLFFKLKKHDPLSLRKPSTDSMWVDSTENKDLKSYLRQY